jgi:hypothetical protein
MTPEYEVYSQSQLEPAEWGRDVVEIEAATKRDAIVLGVKEMLKGGKRDDWTRNKYCLETRADGCNPFAGVTAECP